MRKYYGVAGTRGYGVYNKEYFRRLSVFNELLASLEPPPLILVLEKRAEKSKETFFRGL